MTHDQTEQKKQRRRGILKAAAGVPALLTLPTGAALAATSFTCIQKGNSLPTPAGLTTATDTWVRYKVTGITFKISAQGNPRVAGFILNSTYYVVSGSAPNLTISVATPANNPQIQTPGNFYYLLVDSDDYSNTATISNFVFLGDANIAQPVAGASCWNSVIARANVKDATSSTNLIN